MMRYLLLAALLAQASPALAQAPDLSGANITAPGGTTARTQTSRTLDAGYSVLEKGAVCDGATDDTTAINAALSSGNYRVTIPANKTCFSSTGITVPPGVTLTGLSFSPSNPPSGSEILCASTVAHCVTVGDGVANKASIVERLIVASNAAGTPSGNTGIYVSGGYNVVLEKTMVYKFYDGYWWHGTSTLGLSGKMKETYSGIIADAHIIQDTWAELRITDGRFGMNGSGDLAGTAFIRETGGVAGSQSGPNGLWVINTQFNQGSGQTVAYLLDFVSCGTSPCLNGTSGITGDEFTFVASHAETIGTAFIHSDSSWNVLDYLTLTDNSFTGNASTQPLFALNAATEVTSATIANNIFSVSDITLSPTGQINNSLFTGNSIIGNLVFSPSGVASSLGLENNTIVGNVTLSGAWNALTLTGGDLLSGTLTTTATGNVNLAIPGQQASINAGTTTAPALAITDTGSNGAQLKLIGNGGTTPSKTIRVLSGQLQITNDSNANGLVTLTDAGAFTVLRGPIVSGNTTFTLSGGCGATTPVGNAISGTFVSGTTGTCNVVITMNGATGMTAAHGWNCGPFVDQTTPGDSSTWGQTAWGTLTANLSGTTVSGDVMHFVCAPY